jgi:hypothetical protein
MLSVMMKYILLIALTILLIDACAQIPVEVFTGHEKVTVDIMFFKYVKNKQKENSEFLFFNRNRASVVYDQTATENFPQFGFTEAISYNHPACKGFAPVLVAQILNRGFYPKAGIQYVRMKNEFTVFSWAVIETTSEPAVDMFLLIRYTPAITDRIHLFTQLESINAMATEDNGTNNFIQRYRLGLKINDWQFGLGGDFSQAGNTTYNKLNNVGIFLRHVF